MTHKFKKAILYILCLSLFSCNSDKVESRGEISERNNIEDDINKKKIDELGILESQVTGDSLNIELRKALAIKYYSIGELNEAEKHYQIILEQKPNNLDASINLGNIYYDSQKNDKAIIYYEKSLLSDPKNTNLRCDLATCYLRIKNYAEAIKILKNNIKIDKNHIQSHHNLSVILKDIGNTKEADVEMAIYTKLNNRN